MLLVVLLMAETVQLAGRSEPNAAPPMALTSPAAPAGATPVIAPGSAPVPNPAPTPIQATPAAPDSRAVSAATPVAAATANEAPAASPRTPDMAQQRDPWVKVNRAIFKFDIALERGLLAPVAHGYNRVLPRVVRYHMTSALFNLDEPLTAVNDLLQLRIGSMGKTVFRFVINSTVGIAGLFDVAKASGVPGHFSGFGQTLGRYGARPGPYVMLPIYGPSNLRDTIGRIANGFLDPLGYVIGGITTVPGFSLFALEGIDWRASSDETMKAVYDATDPYAFVRSAYSQARAASINEATGKQADLPDFEAVPGTP